MEKDIPYRYESKESCKELKDGSTLKKRKKYTMFNTTLIYKGKKHTIISMQSRHLTKSHTFHDKNTQKTRYRREHDEGNMKKGIYEKPTGNIILTDARLKAFPLKS